jgi:hypothetical protein
MMPWPQHIHDEMETTSDDSGEPVAAVSIWTDDTEHRINIARMQDLDDHIDVKIHTNHFAGSGLPMDLSGCECLVSMDSETVRDPDHGDEPDESYYGTISNQRSVGQHIIVSLPTTGPVAYVSTP